MDPIGTVSRLAPGRCRFKSAVVLSLPNLLTLSRIVAVPALGALLWWPSWHTGFGLAFALYCLMGLTDYFDGYLARAWQQTSTIGRMLDPIADKLLVAAALLVLAADGTIAGWSIWAAIVILCREILVSGLREYLAELKVSVPVTRLAKWKTAAQMVAIAFLLAGPAGDQIFPYVTELGILFLWIAALITLYTGYDYFRAGLRHIDV